MSTSPDPTWTIPNGPGAAAILAAGIGCAAIGALTLAGEASKAIGKLLNFYAPVGTLSGVTSVAIVVWLLAWLVLARRWEAKSVAIGAIVVAAFALLLVGLLLTFPPLVSLIKGS